MIERSNQTLPILVVEDSDEDFDVLTMAFATHAIQNPVIRAAEGNAVVSLLDGLLQNNVDLPGLIILDLNLIGVDGREVLRRLKRSPSFSRIPVIVFSTSSSPKDIDASYACGAACYAVKPVSLEKLEAFVEALKTFWIDKAILPRRSDRDRFGGLNA